MGTSRLIGELPGWAPVTEHYETSDGAHWAVEASVDAVPEGALAMVEEQLVALGTDLVSTKQIVRPTLIFACTPEGQAVDLTPLHEFPPGTTHEEALTQAGYSVTKG